MAAWTLTDGVQTIATFTKIEPPAPAVAGWAPAVISATDPGAIGAGRVWLRIDANYGFATLFVRNAGDTGWVTSDGGDEFANGAAAYGSNGANATPTAWAQVGADSVDMHVQTTDETTLSQVTLGVDTLTLRAGKAMMLNADGVFLGTSSDPALLTGSVDPSAGGGLAAPMGSLFLRNTGELWQKSGAGDTAWTKNS